MEALLRSPIRAGRLKVTVPDGRSHVLNGTAEGPAASIRIADKRLLRRMLVMPDLYLGEAYMEGLLVDELDGIPGEIAKCLTTVPLTRTYLARWDDANASPCPPV